MIVFLRHAQRGDNQIPMKLSQIEYDPPIIEAADATILQTSKQLAQIFSKHGIKQFKILSSKFLRCLMTGKKLQQNLQNMGFKMAEPSFKVDNRISQYMREDWFAEYPLNKLIFHSQHLEKYIQAGQFDEHGEQKQQLEFPQNYVKFHFRVADFKKQLKFPEPGTALLIVTHGFVVRQLCFTMNQLPKYQNEIKYCGYAAYMMGKNQQILIRSKL